MKNLILKAVEWAVYRMAEYTPPEVKYSERNFKVAKAALAVGELRDFLKPQTKKNYEHRENQIL